MLVGFNAPQNMVSWFVRMFVEVTSTERIEEYLSQFQFFEIQIPLMMCKDLRTVLQTGTDTQDKLYIMQS